MAASGTAAADVATTERATGGITITWRGDPARGCADIGLCDVTGSATFRAPEGTSSSISSRVRVISMNSVITLGPAVARVLRGPLESPIGSCVDGAGYLTVGLEGRRAGGLVTFTTRPFDQGFGAAETVAGRCAGPLADDLLAAMPTAEAERSRVLSGDITLDFSGRRPFSAGPFSGGVVSTLRIMRRSRIERERRSRRRPVRPPGRSSRAAARRVQVSLTRRIARISGTLVSFYRGLPLPACHVLDACGLSGRQDVTVDGSRGAMSVRVFAEGSRKALRGRGRAAVGEALRAGRLRPEGTSYEHGLRGTVTTSVGRDGGAPCREGRDLDLPALGVRGTSNGLRISLGDEIGAASVRTRCPGPVTHDLGRDWLAAATIPWGDLAGERRLTVRLRPPAATGDAFAVSSSGELILELGRSRVEVYGARR